MESSARNADRVNFVFTQMIDEGEAQTHRRNIARYRYLLENLRDQRMRAYLEKLIKESEERLAEIDPDRRS